MKRLSAMPEIHIAELFGPCCIVADDGAKMYETIREALSRGNCVCLDFGGVTTLASAFLTPAIGSLFASFTKEDLDRRLTWKDLDPADEAVLRIVQRNAIRFYLATKPQQEALLAAANRAPE
jgi:hypothetical protein